MSGVRKCIQLILLIIHVIGAYTKDDMIAKGVKGFRAKGKFFKIMGPKGNMREAFQKFEENEDDMEPGDPEDGAFEEKIQEEEMIYYQYKQQRDIAKKLGVNPDEVEIPNRAKEFMDENKVDSSSTKKGKKVRNGKKKGKKGRSKRMAIKDDRRFWTKGIIPYVFTSEIKTKEEKMGRIRAQRRYEYWTCIRFVPWTKDTGTKYGLDHNNYIIHVDNNGCWSILGNNKGNGQKISCCMDAACVHELGHAMGLHHEQKSHLHDDFIRINFENVLIDRVKEYQEEDPANSKTFGYYDLASTMHYNRFFFTANSEPTMTVYNPDLEFLMLNPDPYNYYVFYEISKTHKCQELRCADFKTKCQNGGYVAFIRDKCTCRCPTGLDPETGCTTKYNGDKSLSDLDWPTDPFSMLKPKEGCPKGFQEGGIKLAVMGGYTSQFYHVDSEQDDSHVTLKFCTKEKSGGNAVKWEPGQYCILNYGGSCPTGFEEGFVTFGNKDTPEVLRKPIPDAKVDRDVTLHFCCRYDGTWFDPLVMPSKEPFVMFEKGAECQEVKDMVSSSDWITIGSDLKSSKMAGTVPDINEKKDGYSLSVCYYWPVNHDCGGVIELTDANKPITISSPNYPNEYNLRQRCQWTIKSPNGTRMKLEFEKFEVELQEDNTCGDYLEVKFTLPGQPGINYCGSTFEPSVITQLNYLGLIFTSGPDVAKQGFKAKVSLLTSEDMCYTGKGEDYRGKFNFTKDFQPCLKWSDVQHCPHNTFNAHDLDEDLDINFCRNPGDGTAPWCYIHRDACLRNYCDPCGLGHCFDKYGDCKSLMSENPAGCTNDGTIRYGCRKSCGLCDRAPDPPVSSVRCKAPGVILNTKPTTALKDSYKVGETVTFQCTLGLEKEVRRCLSNGKWSGGGFVCGKCPYKWIPHHKKCYRFFDVQVNKTAADLLCKKYDAAVTSSKDADENSFLMEMRNDIRAFWLGMEEVPGRGTHRWTEDSSQLTWTNWKSGKSSACAFMDREGRWVGVRCNLPKYISVVCKFSPTARKRCVDANPNCERKITYEPGACNEYPEFKWHSCPKSCGFCKDKDVVCKKPSTPSHSKEISGKKEAQVGEVFEYQCDAGFIVNGGNLRRACLSSGKLTGELPNCVSEKTIPTPNFFIELRQRRRDGGLEKSAFTGDNEALRIHRNGKLVRWEFYSIYDGTVALQVWRKKPGKIGKTVKLRLVGQNIVPSTKDHRVRKVEVPEAEQISVQEGDLIGFYLPLKDKGGITLEKCNKKLSGQTFGNQLVYYGKERKSEEFLADQEYVFKQDKLACKVISLTAYVL